jgi:NADH:ubiquinone oxidoreductase subunit
MSDDIPRDEKSFAWQKIYQPNLTGTKYAYDPSKLSNKDRVYNQWRPK